MGNAHQATPHHQRESTTATAPQLPKPSTDARSDDEDDGDVDNEFWEGVSAVRAGGDAGDVEHTLYSTADRHPPSIASAVDRTHGGSGGDPLERYYGFRTDRMFRLQAPG